MGKVQVVLDTESCNAVNIGTLDNLGDHVYRHPKTDLEMKGKIFLGEVLKSTAMEVSFQILPPQSQMPYLHSHKENEELYIFLKGEGEFHVDNIKFTIKEGSVVRVAPAAKRIWENNSDEPMIFIIIQAHANSLNRSNVLDGVIHKQ